MKLRNMAKNHIKIEITGADVAGFLTYIGKAHIPVFEIIWKDALSVSGFVPSQYVDTLKELAERSGVSIKTKEKFGYKYIISRMIRRPVMITGILLVIFISSLLPTRILQVEVEGNHTIPDRYIIEAAEQCGISFGAGRSKVRSEAVKNRLLEKLPQLQWAGINTYGCRAVISVTEKELLTKNETESKVSSMVAANDGIIRSITATKGNMLCTVGQAVKRGQVLISGYLDCGNKIQAMRAEGVIFAYTKRNLTVLCPRDYLQKVHSSVNVRKITVIFGKNRINLFKDSGISTTGCDKMYEEYPLTLPGGLVLPVALAVEHWKGYNTEEDSLSANTVTPDLHLYAKDYLMHQMISGTIIHKSEETTCTNNAVRLKGVYNCLEMIGRTRTEEIIDGKDH